MHWEHIYQYILKEGDCCIDIGANEGLHSVIMKRLVGPSGTVHALEPHPTQFSLLAEKKDQGIITHHQAMKDYSGMTNLYYSDQDGLENKFGGSTTLQHLATPTILKSDTIRCVPIPCITLDNLCAQYNLMPNFIKIDTEGAEAEVINGGLQVIEQQKPHILFEYISKVLGFQPPESVNILRKYNYNFFIATLGIKKGMRQKKEPSKFISIDYEQINTLDPVLCDVLAVHSERMHALPGNMIISYKNYFEPWWRFKNG